MGPMKNYGPRHGICLVAGAHRARKRSAAALLLLIGASSTLPIEASADTLQQALNSAYRANPQLDAERARLRATDEEVSRAHANFRPVITGSGDVTYTNTNTDPPTAAGAGGTATGENTSRGFSISGTQPIFRGFRLFNTLRESEAVVRAGRETLRSVESTVLLEAVTAYMDVVRDQALVRVRENNLNVLNRDLKATQDRFAVGEVTRTDVAQAEARRAGAVSALDLARANLKTSRASYERVIGVAPSNLQEPRPADRYLPKAVAEAISISSRESPSVVAALYREQAARHTVDRIRGELLPTINLNATYGKRFNPSRVIDETETTTVAGTLSVPIYSGGEIEARVRQAKHTHVSRLQEIEQNRALVQQQVVAAWSLLEASRAQLQSDQAQVAANRTALNGVREEERVGQRTLLDVLNAEQELLLSEVNLITTKRNIVVNSYSVLSTIGRLNIQELGVSSSVYDPEVHYNEVRRKWTGLSITHHDGRHEHFQAHQAAPSKDPAPSKKAAPKK
jgi:outer membrane protein